MEFLNQAATIVFAALIDSLNNKDYRKIKSDPFMPLLMEQTGTGIQSPWGSCDLYSLCHYFEQNDYHMKDPEMCFFVADNRQGFKFDWAALKVGAYRYRCPGMDDYQESIRMEDQRLTVFHRKLQKDHTVFANQWLTNIRQQGFLNNLTGNH